MHCYSNNTTIKHLWQYQYRLQEFNTTLYGSNTFYTFLGFTVKRNIDFNIAGKFVSFYYGVVGDKRIDSCIRSVTYSVILNNNQVIKELTRNDKTQFESNLGGLR
ncbi:hypothetical protein UXU46_01335 [Campylobacter jejuni]